MQGAYVNLGSGQVVTPEEIIATGLRSSETLKPRKWFAVSNRTHHEKRVAERLTERGIVSFLPLYKTEHPSTRKVILDLQLFPSYIFVHISLLERIPTVNVAGVGSMVDRGWAQVAPAHETECLHSGRQLRKVKPHRCLAAGKRVRIKAGPLAGMERVVPHNKSTPSVVLRDDLLMQSVAVEVNAVEIGAGSCY